MLTESGQLWLGKLISRPKATGCWAPEPVSEAFIEAFEQFLANWVRRERLIAEEEARRRQARVRRLSNKLSLKRPK